MYWKSDQTLSWIIREEPLELTGWTSEMGPKIEAAQTALANRMGVGDIRAGGRKDQQGSLEKVPAGDFRFSSITLVVAPQGDLATLPRHRLAAYKGSQWNDI